MSAACRRWYPKWLEIVAIRRTDRPTSGNPVVVGTV
jgi:hypothetical protein